MISNVSVYAKRDDGSLAKAEVSNVADYAEAIAIVKDYLKVKRALALVVPNDIENHVKVIA